MNIFVKIILITIAPIIIVSGLYTYNLIELKDQLDSTIEKRLINKKVELQKLLKEYEKDTYNSSKLLVSNESIKNALTIGV